MYQYEFKIVVFWGGVDLPPGVPELSHYASINMHQKLLFSGGVDLPLDLPCGLSELPGYACISMNLKLLFWGA